MGVSIATVFANGYRTKLYKAITRLCCVFKTNAARLPEPVKVSWYNFNPGEEEVYIQWLNSRTIATDDVPGTGRFLRQRWLEDIRKLSC
jgi:hypothetical protein